MSLMSSPLIFQGPFNESAQKNKQILCGGAKKKSALQAGYFDPQFKRIFEKEALTDLIKIQRQYRIQQAKKNLGKAFLPSSGEKKPLSIYFSLSFSCQRMNTTAQWMLWQWLYNSSSSPATITFHHIKMLLRLYNREATVSHVWSADDV